MYVASSAIIWVVVIIHTYIATNYAFKIHTVAVTINETSWHFKNSKHT